MLLCYTLLYLVYTEHWVTGIKTKMYELTRLDTHCDLGGKKVRIALGTRVHVFSFNSSDSNLQSLKCHLELSVPSSLFGFSVFLEEMSLAGSVQSGCPHDFVQFGRDILFVTTHMSSKYCGDIETPLTTDIAGVTNIHFPVTPLASRIYREDSDREMDIWIHVTKEDQVEKILSLVVTPVMKNCKGKDRDYKQCGYRESCIRKELFCDGRVNCVSQHTKPSDESECATVPTMIENTWTISNTAPVFLFLAVAISILVLVIIMIFRRSSTTPTNTQATVVHHIPQPLPPQLLPSCPPPYSEETPPHNIIEENKILDFRIVWDN